MKMLAAFLQAAQRKQTGLARFRHFGALGLFFLAILDSSPLPTFGGPDILTVILVVSRRDPWYEYAAIATAGSIIGAYLTFMLARRAGNAYLHSKFGRHRAASLLKVFERWGTTALAASTAIPFPFPTSVFFAAAGASGYSRNKYLAIVGICRAVRYTAVAVIADLYGRRLLRVLRHPTQHWGWLVVVAIIFGAVIGGGLLFRRHLEAACEAEAAVDGERAEPQRRVS